jgi:chromosome segregation ATPase
LIGLNGETATERLIRMRDMVADLERENEELRQQNAGLQSRVKESQDQLVAGIRDVQNARKELSVARGDLDRLRSDMQALRDKVRIAEREYTAILQSLGPLLQQLFESDDVSALPPNPTE